jgi:hypothetical protein
MKQIAHYSSVFPHLNALTEHLEAHRLQLHLLLQRRQQARHIYKVKVKILFIVTRHKCMSRHVVFTNNVCLVIFNFKQKPDYMYYLRLPSPGGTSKQ